MDLLMFLSCQQEESQIDSLNTSTTKSIKSGDDTRTTAQDTAPSTDSSATTHPTLETDIAHLSTATFVGEEPYDGWFGMAIQAGDSLDEWGVHNLMIGMAGNTAGGSAKGTVYLLQAPFIGVIDLSTVSETLIGSPVDLAGWSVVYAGDLNSDGFGDMVIGAPGAGYPNMDGVVYLIQGPVSGRINLEDTETVFYGEATDSWGDEGSKMGASIATNGDIDGDGLSDIVIGAYCYDLCSGSVYLYPSSSNGKIQPSEASARIYGGPIDWLGYKLNVVDDTDGDGLNDLLISSGETVLLFTGSLTGVLSAADADGVIYPEGSNHLSGGLAGAGDMNGDGYGDVIFGDATDETVGRITGSVYLSCGPFAPITHIENATAKLTGTEDLGGAGYAVASGDFNGDTSSDFLIGAPGYPTQNPGTAYVVYGPVTGTILLSDADVILHGDGVDQAGSSVINAGDMDGDGTDDILISGPGDDAGGEKAGAAWLVLGASL